MGSIIGGRRHVIAHVNESKQAVRHLHHIDDGARQQQRGNLRVVADHNPVPARFGELRSVLESDLVAQVFLL